MDSSLTESLLIRLVSISISLSFSFSLSIGLDWTLFFILGVIFIELISFCYGFDDSCWDLWSLGLIEPLNLLNCWGLGLRRNY